MPATHDLHCIESQRLNSYDLFSPLTLVAPEGLFVNDPAPHRRQDPMRAVGA